MSDAALKILRQLCWGCNTKVNVLIATYKVMLLTLKSAWYINNVKILIK